MRVWNEQVSTSTKTTKSYIELGADNRKACDPWDAQELDGRLAQRYLRVGTSQVESHIRYLCRLHKVVFRLQQ